MYTVVLTQQIKPGSLNAFKQWLRDADAKRLAKNPDYSAPRRYLTSFGPGQQFIAEFDMEAMPEEPWVYAEMNEGNPGASEFIIPGTVNLSLLKRLDP